jgi:hypothetical protein
MKRTFTFDSLLASSRVQNCVRVDINADGFDATACKPQGSSPTVAANLQGSLSAV